MLFINPSCASIRGNCDVEKRNLVCSRNKWHKAGALYLWQLWLKIGQLHADNIPQECRSCRLCQDTPNTPPAILISWYQSTIQHNLKIILVKIISTQPFLPIFFLFSIYSFGLKLLKKGKLQGHFYWLWQSIWLQNLQKLPSDVGFSLKMMVTLGHLDIWPLENIFSNFLAKIFLQKLQVKFTENVQKWFNQVWKTIWIWISLLSIFMTLVSKYL